MGDLITSALRSDDADELTTKVHGAVGRPMVSQVSNAATDVTSESPDTRPTQVRRDIETPMFLLPQTAARDGRLTDALHSHRCGLTALGEMAGYGCGHEWTHASKAEWNLKDHYCPVCGKGPFTFRVGSVLKS